MNTGLLLGIGDVISDVINSVLAFIPKFVYFLISCLLSLIDLCQVIFRKMAGLDVVSINNNDVQGDMLYKIITDALFNDSNPAVKTLFWSLIIFAIFMLIVTTIIAVIRTEYSGENNSKSKIIGNFFKAFGNFLILPVASILGIFICSGFVQLLDKITYEANTQTAVMKDLSTNFDKWGKKSIAGQEVYTKANDSYIGFNLFGTIIPTSSETFSGIIFKACAYSCNRARNDVDFFNKVVNGTKQNFNVFNEYADSQQKMAEVIDLGFSVNAKLQGDTSYSIEGSFLPIGDTDGITYLNRGNPELVYYYYNLWTFNYIIVFIALAGVGKLYYKFALGLLARLFELFGLFLASPIVVSIMPLDNGKAVDAWKKNFIGRVLILGVMVMTLNLINPLLSFAQGIKLFKIPVLDYIVLTFFMIAALNAVDTLNGMFAGMFGAEKSVIDNGGKISEQFTKGVGNTLGAVDLVTKPGQWAAKGVGKVGMFGATKLASGIKGLHEINRAEKIAKRTAEFDKKIADSTAADNESISQNTSDIMKVALDENLNIENNSRALDYMQALATKNGDGTLTSYLDRDANMKAEILQEAEKEGMSIRSYMKSDMFKDKYKDDDRIKNLARKAFVQENFNNTEKGKELFNNRDKDDAKYQQSLADYMSFNISERMSQHNGIESTVHTDAVDDYINKTQAEITTLQENVKKATEKIEKDKKTAIEKIEKGNLLAQSARAAKKGYSAATKAVKAGGKELKKSVGALSKTFAGGPLDSLGKKMAGKKDDKKDGKKDGK